MWNSHVLILAAVVVALFGSRNLGPRKPPTTRSRRMIPRS